MSILKTAAGVGLAFLALGVVSGGVARTPDGKVDVAATFDQGAKAGGDLAGQAADSAGNSLGHGLGSAISSSDLAKVAVAGGTAAGVVKYGPKMAGSKIQPKPVTVPALTPTTQPPKRRTGWCKDVVTGAVAPCEPVKTTAPSTPQSVPTTSTTSRSDPMSSGGFTVPSWSVPPATWKPCIGSVGVVVSC